MPDNIPISPGQGATIATDQDPVTGAHYQRVKLMDGTEGSRDAIQSDGQGSLQTYVTEADIEDLKTGNANVKVVNGPDEVLHVRIVHQGRSQSGSAAIMGCIDGNSCTLWGNGFGAKNGVTRDGTAASAAPYSLSDLETADSCTLTIGGAAAQVTYCGAAPGQIIDQLNFIYPSGIRHRCRPQYRQRQRLLQTAAPAMWARRFRLSTVTGID